MPRVDVVAECPVFDSFRVQQVAGMFDVPLAEKLRAEFSVEVPDLAEEWQLGVIVGPSGSGKSTIARQAFGEQLYAAADWPAKKAVVDCFGDLSIKDITHALTAVGFSSPPAWVKPYHVLSNGERFRCDLARALLAESPLIAFDEFTSVVDRTVAKVGSAAIAKAIRGGKIARRFVAVTCHYDVVEWLEPDWVLDMATRRLKRRRLRRPVLECSIYRGRRLGWPLFAPHHYLSANLAKTARCYYAVIEGQLVGICAFLPMLGKAAHWRVTRIVVLPDFQGIGVGAHLLQVACELVAREGKQVSITTSHPAMIAHLSRSSSWRVKRVSTKGSSRPGRGTDWRNNYKGATGRAYISAYFRPAQ
jgi:GNAT superfamily N-acetyltransferase/alpha-D-ribose 1-methylphosphonate 5-triphosphate synthase subunit PhnL